MLFLPKGFFSDFTSKIVYVRNSAIDEINSLEVWQSSIYYAGLLVDGTKPTKRLMYYFFSYFLAKLFAQILSIFFLLFYNFTKIKIQSIECQESKPATLCFTFNLSKKYLDHQMLGQWDNQPSNPAYYIEDCPISYLQM